MSTPAPPNDEAGPAADPPPPHAPRPHPRHWGRRLAAAAATALLLMALVLAALWWWSGSEGSLARALGWLNVPGLQAQNVSGNVRHGGHVGHLRWQGALDRTVEARDVTLRWSLRAALERRLHLRQLHIGELTVHWPKGDEPNTGPPESLTLPFQVGIDQLQIDQLQWTGPPALAANDLEARYDYNGQRHALTLTQAALAQGRYSGQAQLQARGPLTLQAQLQGVLSTAVPGSANTLPLRLEVHANGPLADLRLQASVESEPAGASSAASAQLSARITPWAEQAVPQAQAVFKQLNLAWLWPQAPQTQLTGQAQVHPGAQASWQVDGQLQNALPGPWNTGRLPLNRAELRAQWRGGSWLLQSLNAQVGAGRVQAQGQWTGASATGQDWQVTTRFEQLNLAALHSQWPQQSLQGQAQWQGSADALNFDVQVQPAPGDSALNTLQLIDAQTRGTWRPAGGGRLDLSALRLRTRQADLSASGQYQAQAQAAQGHWRLQAPGLSLRGAGEARPDKGQGQTRLQAHDLAATWRWLNQLPGLAAYLPAKPTPGRADLTLSWQGGWRDPALQASLDIPSLDWPGATTPAGGASEPLQLRALQLRLDGRLSQAKLSASGQLMQGTRRLQLAIAADAGAHWAARPGAQPGLSWQASVQQLTASLNQPAWGSGAWQLNTQRPFTVKGVAAAVEVQAGQALLSAPQRPGGTTPPAVLDWQVSRWQPGRLRTAGTLQGLPQAWLELMAGSSLAGSGVVGDLLFDGRWDMELTDRLRVQAELARRSGDLSIHAETGQGLASRVAAGVKEARLSLQGDGEVFKATVLWDSERAGKVQGWAQSRLSPPSSASGTGWRWADEAAISGQLQAQLPRIGVWSLLAPPGWRLRGSLTTKLQISGTRQLPQVSGELQADDLALRSVVDGIELGGGRLRARLDGNRLLVDEFMLQGAGPSGSGGQITATGQASWLDGQPQVQLKAELQQLRASVRADRQLTVSGDLQAGLRGREGELTGALRVDQARLELPNEERPQLDSDVVVRSGPRTAVDAGASRSGVGPAPTPAAAAAKRKISVAVRVDLGDNFRVQGKGVSTRLRGALAITDESLGTPRLFGTVTTFEGEYRAYGQRLDIDRGVLRFNGPADNPSLDVLAIRPNLTQRVGVQITGTALLPRVRLYADPELPEAEKLSWLVLGHSSASGGAEAALLQQAAIALLGSGKGGSGRNLASTLGLDELSFRTPSTQADGTPSAGAVMLGKRFSRNFYAAYERSLSGTLGTLYMFYELSQRFTVRAQAGEQTAVDLIFTVPYE